MVAGSYRTIWGPTGSWGEGSTPTAPAGVSTGWTGLPSTILPTTILPTTPDQGAFPESWRWAGRPFGVRVVRRYRRDAAARWRDSTSSLRRRRCRSTVLVPGRPNTRTHVRGQSARMSLAGISGLVHRRISAWCGQRTGLGKQSRYREGWASAVRRVVRGCLVLFLPFPEILFLSFCRGPVAVTRAPASAPPCKLRKAINRKRFSIFSSLST